MKKHLKKSKKIIVIPIILLAITLSAFFIMNIKTTHSNLNQQNDYYASLSATRQEVYDKLIVKDVKITERKTGEAPFNTTSKKSVDDGSVTSNKEGIDVSENDNYVRTFDKVTYTLEVSIDKNPNIDSNTVLKGGAIKVKATIPKGDNGEVYGNWTNDVWMQSNYSRTSNYTVITATYEIPESASLVGGTQELSFTLNISGYTADLLSDDQKVQFEVWMEGNKPDNSSSKVQSRKITDSELYISGKEYMTFSLSSGTINYTETVDGVEGQYINFAFLAYMGSPNSDSTVKGNAFPTSDTLTSDIELKYYYRPANSSGSWNLITDSTSNANGALNGAQVVAVNFTTVSNDNAKPFNTSNTSSYYNYNYCVSSPYYCTHPGTASGSLNSNTITMKASDYYVNHTSVNKINNWSAPTTSFVNMTIALELFVPFYTNGSTEYEYKVVATIKDVETKNSASEIAIDKSKQISTSSQTITFSKNTSNAVSSYLCYSSYVSNYTYGSTSYKAIGESIRLETLIKGTNSVYYGGLKKLITWEAKYFVPSFISTFGGNNYASGATYKYGVYKNDTENGLESLSEVNTATENDFTWYTTLSSAQKAGTITAILIDEPNWYGTGMGSYNYIKGEISNDTSLIGEVSYFRQKVYLYKDKERTIVETYLADDGETYYTPSTYNDTTKLTSDTPSGAGISSLITAQNVSSTIKTKNSSGNYTTSDSKYDVSNGSIDFKVTSSFTPTAYEDETITKTDITITVRLPKSLEFVESSASIAPDSIRKTTNYTYIHWVFKNQMVGDQIDDIYFKAEIDPFTENNQSDSIYVYTSNGLFYYNNFRYTSEGTSYNIYYNYYSNKTISISNLSGASTRKSIEKQYLEIEESNLITNKFYNVSDSTLTNVKSVDVLPQNDDIYGSDFNGSYQLKIISKASNQKIYYTTSDAKNAGIIEDEYGNLSAQSINFASNSHWIEVNVNDLVPSNAKYIGTTLGDMASGSELEFAYEFIPKGNSAYDTYSFRNFMTSDTLTSIVSSYILETSVGDRVISGTMFVDKNRNDIKNTNEVFEGFEVTLLDSNKKEVATTKTDENGYYEFSGLTKQDYYIQVKTSSNYEIVKKNAGLLSNSSVLNSDGITDAITSLNVEMRELVTEAGNINVGIKPKEATLTVHHYIEGTNSKLADTVTTKINWGEKYSTSPASVDSNYELAATPSNATGTISGDTTVIYYYKLKTATLTVHHYIEGTKTSLVADEISTVTYTHTYTTSASNNVSNNYELASTKGTLSGTVTGNIEVTYYYKLKSSTLTVKHLEYGTNKVLASTETKDLKYTDEYETSISTSIPGNYEYHSKTDNYKGIASSDTIEVIYYYQKKDSQLSSEIKLTVPEEITDKNEKVDYKIDYETTISDYKGEGTISIIANLPYHIAESNSDLNGGTYNSDLKTITWTITEEVIDAAEESKTITIEKEFSVIFTDLNPTDRIVNTSVTGNIKLDNNERDNSDTAPTFIKISSKIIVHHYIEGTTNKIVDDIETTDLVGETYVSEPLIKEGYILKKEPDNRNHTYQEETLEVIYEYERIKFNITTKITGDGGTIYGDEDVFYGESSTEGNIVIKPSEGYQVSKIIINGIEENIEQCKNGCVLGQFIDVQENKEIIVEFKKIPDNPATSSIITRTTIIGLSVLSIISYIIIKKSKPRIKKV